MHRRLEGRLRSSHPIMKALQLTNEAYLRGKCMGLKITTDAKAGLYIEYNFV